MLETWVASPLAPRSPPPPAPRHGKADLLSYHCSSAAPASPARPPPGAAARAADTMRGQRRTPDPPGAPGTGGGSHPPAKGLGILCIAPHSLVRRHLAGQRADTRRRGVRGRGILPLVENQPWHKLLWPQACRDGETLVQRCPCTTGCLLLILLAKVLEQADPAVLHPMPAFPTRWEVGTPFSSLLTVRKGLHSTKVHPNTAAGYLEPVAPIPGRGRAAASGGLDVFFLIAGQALSPAKQHVSHFL